MQRNAASHVQAYSLLAEAAAALYFDANPFLTAYAGNSKDAIIAMRDDPARFGRVRNYLGRSQTAALHNKLLATARRHYKITFPADNVRQMFNRSTRRDNPA